MMDRPTDLTATNQTDDPLARGDAAAEREDWPKAVAAWKQALSTAQRDDAIARLQWFIAWRTERPIDQPDPPHRHRKPLELFLGFLACSLFAVAAVFVAEDTSGALALMATIVAWLFIVAASALSLIYARYSDPDPESAPRYGKHQARSLAERASKLATPPSRAAQQR